MLNYEECLKDSPAFRKSVAECEKEVFLLKDRYSSTTETCHKAYESGSDFELKFNFLCENMSQLLTCFQDNDRTSDALQMIFKIYKKFGEVFKKLLLALNKTHSSIQEFIYPFKLLNTHKKSFERASDNLDNTLQKAAAVSCNKPLECEAVDKLTQNHQTEFNDAALDYVYHLRLMKQRKNLHVIDSLMELVNGFSEFFNEGSEYFKNVPLVSHINNQRQFLHQEFESEKKNLDKRQPSSAPTNSNNPEKIEGYLFKKPTKKFRNWSRRWFTIEKNQLKYCNRSEYDWSILENNLSICRARALEGSERRFSFEILVPGRNHILQAHSLDEMNTWLQALQPGNNFDNLPQYSSITDEDSSESARKENRQHEIKQNEYRQRVLSCPGNDVCCDCKVEKAEWASVNLGITLCTECSAIHRSFGVQVSRVRSFGLDNWEPEILRVMLSLGNTVANSIFDPTEEELKTTGLSRATTKIDHETRKTLSTAKWIERRFVRVADPSDLIRLTEALKGSDDALETQSICSVDMTEGSFNMSPGMSLQKIQELVKTNPSLLLYKAAANRNLPLMLQALAYRADVNWINTQDEGRTPLIQAVVSKSLTACEFLMKNQAKVNLADQNGQTPLHYACERQRTKLVCLLLRRSADQLLVDKYGQTPLSIAMHHEHADIVTLLRLQSLNQLTRDTDNNSDETVMHIFKDFIQKGYDDDEDISDNNSATLTDDVATNHKASRKMRSS